MAKYQVLKTKVTVNAGALKVVKPPSIDFNIEVEINNKIFNEAKKDPLLRKKFAAQAKEILDQTQKTVFQRCKVFDKLFVGMLDDGEDIKVVQKNLDGLNQALKQDYKVAIIVAEMGVKKVWDELIAHHKTWKNFKIKTVASIFGAIVAIPTATLAGLAFAIPSFGASTALAYLATAKSCVIIAGNIKKLAIGMDSANKQLRSHLKTIETLLTKKGLNELNEVSGAIFAEFIGTSQPTIISCISCFKTLTAHHSKSIIENHRLSVKIQKLYNGHEELRREWEKEVKIRLNKHPTSKKSDQQKKIMNQFDSNTKSAKAKISSCSAKCLSMYEKNTKMTKELKELAQRVEELKIKDPKGLKAFRKALKYCNKAFSTLPGDTIKSGAVALAEDIGSAGASYVYDTLASKALKGTVLDPA